MTEADRIDALEEKLGWLQHELEQLSTSVHAQAVAHERLEQRLTRIERRLERLEQGDPGAHA